MAVHLDPGPVRLIAIDRLRTTYAALRPGTVPHGGAGDPTPLPIRVMATEAGDPFEVLDGFKRLATSTEQGVRELPVVVEPPAARPHHKRLLLAANTPPRTLTALDEARVVCSLSDEDHLTPSQIARLLGKRRSWVEARLTIGRRLCAAGQR